jgi:hypothetical protein
LKFKLYVFANFSNYFGGTSKFRPISTCTSFSLLSSIRFRPGLDPSGQYSFSSFLQGKLEVQIPHHVGLLGRMKNLAGIT